MTLQTLETVTVGAPIERCGISLFPLYLPENELPAIATGEASGLVIDELDTASVQALRATNPTNKPVLLVEGEHFLGGKQNRAVNTSVLVDSMSSLEVPVSCLEQGRWGSRMSWRRADAFAPARVRATKRAGVSRSMRESGSRHGDQDSVWEEVGATLRSEGVASHTEAAADLDATVRWQSSRAEAVAKLVEKGPLKGQCGIAVAVGGRIASMDLFGAPHLLAPHWGKLVRSHFVEQGPDLAGRQPSRDQVQALVQRFGCAPGQNTPGVGLGTEHRIADIELTGQALTLDGAVVHAAFSYDGEPVGPKSRGNVGVDADRAKGLMAGIATGNLLGIAMEGWPRSAIARKFPDGVRDVMASSGYPDDDDLAQAIEIADAAATGGGLDVDDLGQRFWRWAETNGAGIGGLTRNVLELYGGAFPQRLARERRQGTARTPAGIPIVEASRRAWRGDRAGNGALMRCAPLAIRWNSDPDRLVRESVISAVPTHWDRRCGWSCALVNLAAAAALHGEILAPEALLRAAQTGMAASLPELRQYGYRAEIPRSVSEAVLLASRSTVAEIRFDGADMGFTLLSLKAAMISYWRAENFESGLSAIVEAGGDTDTNGAIVGAVLGARFGRTGIPTRWLHRVDEIRTGRVSMESRADRLTMHAGGGGRPETSGRG